MSCTEVIGIDQFDSLPPCLDEWVNTHGEEQLLPGLNFTPRQMFWISAANVWCSKSRPQALKLSVLTGTHSPDQFRVQVEIEHLGRNSFYYIFIGSLLKHGSILERF